MFIRHPLVLSALAACILGASIVIAQERTRATVPDQYKWNLAELYAGDEAWQAERTRIEQELPKARAFKGTLGQSAAQLQKGAILSERRRTSERQLPFQRCAISIWKPPERTWSPRVLGDRSELRPLQSMKAASPGTLSR